LKQREYALILNYIATPGLAVQPTVAYHNDYIHEANCVHTVTPRLL